MRWDFTHLARRTPTVWHLVVSLLLWEFTLLSTPAHATPTDLFGFGARSPALAMGGVASSENAEAAHLNPARLALLRRKSILIGASGGRYRVGIDGETTPIEAVRSTMIGFVLPLGFGDVLEKRLVIGGAFYTPLGALLRGDVRFAEVPHWAVINRAHSLGLSVAMGIDMSGLVDGLAIGGGVSALATLVGDLRVQLDETNTFQSVVETQLLASFSPIVGVSFEEPIWMREHPSAPSRFGFGVVYRHELRSDMDLKVVVSDLPVRVPVLNLAGTIQYDPPQVAIEGFARPWPWVRLSAQLHARFWSAYPGPARATSSNSLAPPRVGFSDTLSPRIAMEVMSDVKALHIVFRTGYAFEASPAPPARLASPIGPDGQPLMGDDGPVPLRIIDNDRHLFGFGIGLIAHLSERERITFDLFGQLHWLPDRTHAIGRSQNAPPMVSYGSIWVGGWTSGIEF